VKGRFGMDFIQHPDRLKKPLIRYKKNEDLKEASGMKPLLLLPISFPKSKKKRFGQYCRVIFCPLHQRRKLSFSEIYAGGQSAPTMSITAPVSDTP
jgi:hypothetical protein